MLYMNISEIEERKEKKEEANISIQYFEAENEEEALSLMRQEDKEGMYYPKVDVSL